MAIRHLGIRGHLDTWALGENVATQAVRELLKSTQALSGTWVLKALRHWSTSGTRALGHLSTLALNALGNTGNWALEAHGLADSIKSNFFYENMVSDIERYGSAKSSTSVKNIAKGFGDLLLLIKTKQQEMLTRSR